MRYQTLTLTLLLTIIFVAVGDLFLPQPLAATSYRARSEINQFFVSLLPKPDFDQIQQNRLGEWEEAN
ncbi:MAG: hypothetical protein GVY17_01375 [Cyanobacteria bacterium]|jgi:hypothetical protein|nr:hypothetical protein [Cyanobacteria bacterium GSL.Bin21]